MGPYQLLKNAYRSLKSDLKNSIINVAGLATGLTVFLMIMIYVHYQYSINDHLDHSEEIFRLERGFGGITNAIEPGIISSQVPGLKGFCRIASHNSHLFYRPAGPVTGNRIQAAGVAADKSIIDIFGLTILEQSSGELLNTPTSIIISSSFAERLFGSDQPLGQIVSMNNEIDLTVQAIFEDLPPESSMSFEVVYPIEILPVITGNANYLNHYGIWRYETYFRINPELKEEIEILSKEVIQEYLAQSDGEISGHIVTVDLIPLKDIYFSKTPDSLHRHGDKTNTYIFILIAGFVLMIAVINFINLSTAQAGKRSKEIGLKKIAGAGRPALILQICTEGVLIMLISLILAIAALEILLPLYSGFVDLDLRLNYTPGNILLILFIAPIVIGTLTGILPAYYLSRISPAAILKKEMVSGKGGARLRTFLTIFQFSISIFLITGTLIINRQLNYMTGYDPGYSTDNIIQVPLNNQINDNFMVFKEKSLSNPVIRGITRMNQQISRTGNVWSVYHGDRNFTWAYIMVDEDFVTVFDLEIIMGEDFSPGMLQREQPVFLVNKPVVNAFEASDIFSEKINNHEIVGVVNDFHTASLRSPIQPVTIGLNPSSANRFAYIKLDPGNPSVALSILKEVWNEFSPDYPLEYEFIKDVVEGDYSSEKRFAGLFFYFTIVSIILSCLGLFALASFVTESRIKEICIRKVHGATTVKIALLLSAGLTGKIIISNIIAWPVAWYYLNRWLDNFVHKAEPGVMQFLIAAIIAQIVAVITTSWHVYATSRKNPAESLKYE